MLNSYLSYPHTTVYMHLYVSCSPLVIPPLMTAQPQVSWYQFRVRSSVSTRNETHANYSVSQYPAPPPRQNLHDQNKTTQLESCEKLIRVVMGTSSNGLL